MPVIELPSGPIAYEDTGGDGPVLVFGHGLLMDGRQWRKVIPLLPGCRCITPTLPMGAHTAPMRPDADLTEQGVAGILADFLDALDLKDVTLVLNDWGGGQFLITDGRDARIGRLVLASCTAFDNYPPAPARPAAALCRLPGGGRLLTKMFGTRFFRHSRLAYGALSKAGCPTGCSTNGSGLPSKMLRCDAISSNSPPARRHVVACSNCPSGCGRSPGRCWWCGHARTA